MNEKKSIPTWSVVAAIAAALALVVTVFMKGAGGDPSRDQILEQRRSQDHASVAPITPPAADNARNVGNPQ